jgi:hypothetical protein
MKDAATQYVLAKYVPDLGRMEPRNIGVIVWSNGRTSTRFVESSEEFIEDAENYDRWIEYWKRLVSGEKLQVRRRRAVSRKSARFLAELRQTQKGNYLLEEGGLVVDKVDNINEVADFLFERLVAIGGPARIGTETLKERCDEIVREANLPNVAKDETLQIIVDGIAQDLLFHYKVGDPENPSALLLRVPLSKQLHVTSAQYKFQSVAARFAKARRFTLYDLPDQPGELEFDSSLAISPAMASLALLRRNSIPLNVSDRQAAIEALGANLHGN